MYIHTLHKMNIRDFTEQDVTTWIRTFGTGHAWDRYALKFMEVNFLVCCLLLGCLSVILIYVLRWGLMKALSLTLR